MEIHQLQNLMQDLEPTIDDSPQLKQQGNTYDPANDAVLGRVPKPDKPAEATALRW